MDTTDPVYGETMFLYVRDPPTEPLRISLHHCTSKPNQKSGELAHAELPGIAELCDGKNRELDVQLKG